MTDYLGMGEETGFARILAGNQQAEANVAHTQATTRYMDQLSRQMSIKADEAKLDFEADKKIAELSQLQAGQGEVNLENMADKMMGIYLKGGRPDKAIQLLKTTNQLQTQQIGMMLKQQQVATQQENQRQKSIGRIAGLLGSAESQEDWDQIKGMVAAMDPQAKQFLEKPEFREFTPQKAQNLQRGLLSLKDRLAAQERTRHNEAMEKFREEAEGRRERLNRSQEELNRARTEESRSRAQKISKEAGKSGLKPVGAPTKTEMSVASDALKNLGLKATDADSMEIAQKAKSLVKNNPGIDQVTATAKVIQDLISKGDIVPKTEGDSLMDRIFGNGKAGTPAQKFSPLKPEELPKDATKLTTGQYYQSPRGLVKYLGNKKFAVVEGNKAPMGGGAAPDDEEDDNE